MTVFQGYDLMECWSVAKKKQIWNHIHVHNDSTQVKNQQTSNKIVAMFPSENIQADKFKSSINLTKKTITEAKINLSG